MIENVRQEKGPCSHQWTCEIYKEMWKKHVNEGQCETECSCISSNSNLELYRINFNV